MQTLPNSSLSRLSQEEQRVLMDWIAFIKSGFELAAFTPRLYRHLVGYASFDAHDGLETFWRSYFQEQTYDFRIFINQFGGDLEVAEYHAFDVDPWWLYPSLKDNRADTSATLSTGLNLAMIEVMRQLYAPVVDTFDILTEQEYELYKEEELIDEWQKRQAEGSLDPEEYPLDQFLFEAGGWYDDDMYAEVVDNFPVSHLIRDAIARAVSKIGWRGPRIAAPQSVEQCVAPQQDFFALYDWRRQQNQNDNKQNAAQALSAVEGTGVAEINVARRRRLTAKTLSKRRRRLSADPHHPQQKRKENPYDKIELTASQR